MFTFSKMSQQVGSAKNTSVVSNDVIKKIESCQNFSKLYSINRSPEEDIALDKIKSVIFKTSEDTLKQVIHFEYWEKSRGEPTVYHISASTKDRQLDTITDTGGYTLPCSSLRFTDQNEVEIVYYGSARL